MYCENSVVSVKSTCFKERADDRRKLSLVALKATFVLKIKLHMFSGLHSSVIFLIAVQTVSLAMIIF